jgi:signal transduction histidine kinase/DNA-binding response OmpR family regulator
MVGGVIFLFRRNTRILLERQKELETTVAERTEQIEKDKAFIENQSEELKALDKVKSKFFANISHELRTPLTLILGPLSYVLDNPEAWEKENIQQQLLVMQRNGKSLMELIEEILDLSKLEANKLELHEEATPVVQFFEYLFFVFKPQFKSQGIDYDLVLNVKEDLHILMDRKKMEKVLNNFLSNAIKFTPENGKITLSVIETDTQLKITISDNGKGIHPNDLPYIFDRFYQSKQPDQQLYGGTGIGLALVNELAQLMGGKAYAESTLGQGSNFYFNIPKKEIAAEQMLPRITNEDIELEQIDSIGTAFTILVVEDNDDMRNFISQLLQNKYERVLLSKNGVEGLNMLKEHGTNIHLIISDVMMPQMDGLTMLKEIKNNVTWNGIPVVMLTALASERDKLTALTIGVDDYLTKPFSVPELLIRVQNLLFNYHQRLEWNKTEASQKGEKVISQDDTEAKQIYGHDKKWVDELTELVKNSFEENTPLNVENLAALVFLSTRQMNRKLKSITGLSPAKFIKEVQLQAARTALEKGTFISISEVSNNFGFEHPTTFSTIFKNRFGKIAKRIL